MSRKLPAAIRATPFGVLPDGREVTTFRVEGPGGMVMVVTDFGATITSLMVPGAGGRYRDVVLGYEDLQGYVNDSSYLGAAIGRYGNRIRSGRFALDGRTYVLGKNDNLNHLHGGHAGFNKVLWHAEPLDDNGRHGIRFSYVSPDGDGGYPGELTVHMTYVIERDHRLTIDYLATTTAPTPVNLTHHSYFNLAGSDDTVLGHEVMIAADAFTPVDSELIPTGEIRDVTGTPFDFREPVAIGERITEENEQIAYGGGYDHNFVLRGRDDGLRHAATVRDPASGWSMDLLTTEPGLQFYSGNFLDGSQVGKRGRVYQRHAGFCLEPQHYPDSPNRPEFPSTILRPGQTYRSQTVFRFSTDGA